jgi:hypothetical protein
MALDLQGKWKITTFQFTTFNFQTFSLEFDAQQNGNDAYAGAYLYYHGASKPPVPGEVLSSYLAQVFTGIFPNGTTRGTVISMIQHNGSYYNTFCGRLDPPTGKITGSWVDVDGNKGVFLLEKQS